jgi:hypothetical protein
MEDQDAHRPTTLSPTPAPARPVEMVPEPSGQDGRVPAVTVGQRYRMRAPSTGRETIIEAEPGKIYRDRETGEVLQVVGMVLPLAPSPSRLPWAVENLRFCPWCDQFAQKDLNDCPNCGRRMGPLTP